MNLAALEQAETALLRNDLIKAQALLDYEISVHPDNVDALTMLGIVHGRARRLDEAVTYLERALEQEPDKGQAHMALASVMVAKGDAEKAIFHAEEACRVMPEDAEVWNHLGLTLIYLGRRADAVKAFAAARDRRPDHPFAEQNLAAALRDSGQDAESIEAWKRVVRRFPNQLAAHMALGELYMGRGQYEESITAGKAATRSAPGAAQAWIMLALALSEAGRTAEAETHLRKAVALDANDPVPNSVLGFWLQEQGRFDEAGPYLEFALRLQPTSGIAHYRLLRAKKVTEEDRGNLAELERMATAPDTPAQDAAYMHYALGKGYEDLGEYETSMGHYDRANELTFNALHGEKGWDREAYAAEITSRIEKPLVEGAGNDSELPVFIVGMIRSGTSLVEQILSTHPDIGGGGEQVFWQENEKRFPEEDVASEYLRLLTKLAPGKARVTDKLPTNYVLLGTMHAAFPNARIIHLTRSPIDNCLSVYTTAYQRPPAFAHNKSNIVFGYQEYQRMMDHWRKVLPADRFMDVSYEELIADREGVTRRMIEFLGLDWDDAVLNHESNTRSVRTPSLWQVRQPLYGTSVERWKRFEPWLGDLLEINKGKRV